MKKVFIKNFGCQMNVRDSEVVAGLIRKDGYDIADDVKTADVVIFNTCSVRQHAEDKVWSEIGRVAKTGRRQHRPVIGLIGCMAQNYREQVFERAPEVDFVVGPSDIEKIPGIVKRFLESRGESGRNGDSSRFAYETKIWETDGLARPDEIYHTGFYEDTDHAYVVISEGCSNFCSYCVVPNVRGPLHNRAHTAIIAEIREAVERGIIKVTLLGQNVNAYTSQNPPITFAGLLRMVNEIKGLKEFGFITSHPRDTSIELFTVMAQCEKLKKYLHLPVQSGSDRILKAMNRGYTRKFYLELVENYRRIVAGGTLTTDIIVGFPGEGDEDFRDTVDLVRQASFDAAYIFKYSPRPHTAALVLADDVSQKEKERRHALILDLQRSISKKKRSKTHESSDVPS